jgi:peptidoglycan/LPS O-acetylase OafA/YrhL
MKNKIVLFVDALINLILGILLLLFSPRLASYLGIPCSNTGFYPTILGGVLIGITIALFVEAMRKDKSSYTGLGLIGAICINICGGIVLTLWLILGDLDLSARGEIILWSLAMILVIISGIELLFNIEIVRHNSRHGK